MKIGIANDHSAVAMKNEVKAYLEDLGYEVVNYGTDTDASVDYPIYGEMVAEAVKNGDVDMGVAICGTGVGIGLACNKVKGIRACTCSEPYSAEYSRRHNDANVVTFGARVIGVETAKQIVKAFVETPFEGGRHQRRVDQLLAIEEKNFK